MRNFIDIVEALQAPDELLVLVHPGSACGSANFNLGNRAARIGRNNLIADLQKWNGAILVADGELSDELAEFPAYKAAITGAIARAKAAKKPAGRIVACAMNTPNWEQKIAKAVKKMGATKIVITGAWTQDDGNGCCDSVEATLKEVGLSATIMASALYLESGADEDYEEDFATEQTAI